MVKKKIRATLKQKKLAKAVIDNIRKPTKAKSLGKLMKEAGYSDSQSKHPSTITQSKGFIAILEEAGCTDELIAKQLHRALNKNGEDYYDYVIRDRSIGRLLVLKKHTNSFGEEAVDALKQLVQVALPPIDPLPGK